MKIVTVISSSWRLRHSCCADHDRPIMNIVVVAVVVVGSGWVGVGDGNGDGGGGGGGYAA